MTRHSRYYGVSIVIAAAFAATIAVGCGRSPSPANSDGDRSPAAAATAKIPRGGELTVSIRTEPQSFNRIAKGRDSTTDLVSLLTQERLVRINRTTDEVEGRLAESWTRSNDGLTYTLKLRQGLTFSDGQPLTAGDVLFSFKAVADEKVASVLADTVMVNGRKIEAAAPDANTIVLTFPEPYGPGLRSLAALPILPKHKLQAALDAGTFATAWGLNTPPADVVGAGPFVLSAYSPGQQVTFTRNPKYFDKDASGGQLPYLDRVVLRVIADQNAEMLALEAGQIDMTISDMRAEDYAPLKRANEDGKVKLMDLGVSTDADSMWFNLRPGAFAKDPRRSWIQRDELRQAIDLAVDRKVFADTVYLGAGVPVYGPITPANKKWFSADVPETPHDPERAKQLIASIAKGQDVRFTLLAQKGRSAHERFAEVVRDELKKIGVTVDVVLLDGGALIQKVVDPSQTYDAVIAGLYAADTDPGTNGDFWLSSGPSHFLNPNQKKPATDWEDTIDTFMHVQMTSTSNAERKQMFDRVQQIFAAHVPMLYFVAPRVFVASSVRVTNVQPAINRPQLLWAPEQVAVTK